MSEHNIQDGISTLTDIELINLFQSGNGTAFGELAGRYLSLIRKRAFEFHSNSLEADDLSQEGLMGLFNAVRTYKPDTGTPFGAYADICIKNSLVSAFRRTQTDKNRIHTNSISLTDSLHLAADIFSQPEECVVEREEERLIWQFICEHLTRTERNVLHLYLSGYSYQEISQRLSITKKSCDNAMQRVRKKLKNFI